MTDAQAAQYTHYPQGEFLHEKAVPFVLKDRGGRSLMVGQCTVVVQWYSVECSVQCSVPSPPGCGGGGCDLLVSVQARYWSSADVVRDVSSQQLQQTAGGEEGQEGGEEVPEDVPEERNAEAEEHSQCRHFPPVGGGAGPHSGADI